MWHNDSIRKNPMPPLTSIPFKPSLQLMRRSNLPSPAPIPAPGSRPPVPSSFRHLSLPSTSFPASPRRSPCQPSSKPSHPALNTRKFRHVFLLSAVTQKCARHIRWRDLICPVSSGKKTKTHLSTACRESRQLHRFPQQKVRHFACRIRSDPPRPHRSHSARNIRNQLCRLKRQLLPALTPAQSTSSYQLSSAQGVRSFRHRGTGNLGGRPPHDRLHLLPINLLRTRFPNPFGVPANNSSAHRGRLRRRTPSAHSAPSFE